MATKKKNKKSSPIQTFIELSEVLTGHDKLGALVDGERSLAESYYKLIEDAFGGQRLMKLLSAFEEPAGDGDSALEEIMGEPELGDVAREIVMLWYMSSFRLPGAERDGAPATPEQYFQGLFWPTIRAHPLGLSGGYFGYWRYPPEN